MANALAIANFFVSKANDEGVELTPMKLLKLVYIAHGWHLAIKDEDLLDEAVEAWQYGPVVPSVYHEFKKYRSGQVTKLGFLFSDFGQIVTPTVEDDDTIQFLNKVWAVYKKYNGLQLSTLTHQPNTPWDIVYNREKGSIIRNQLIKEHYLTKAENSPVIA